MNKADQTIMVIGKGNLFDGDYFENGFRPWKGPNFESRILENYKWMRRGDAEIDPTHKQPIAYALIVNPKLKKVFAYQRASKDKHYHDKRLQGKWSWGVGGHIEKEDIQSGNPIRDSKLRELREEVKFVGGGVTSTRVLGYINDDTQYDKDTKNEVVSIGRVHFGVLYLIETDAKEVKPKDKESQRGSLVTIERLENICKSLNTEVETWSEIALQPLKEYINNQN